MKARNTTNNHSNDKEEKNFKRPKGLDKSRDLKHSVESDFDEVILEIKRVARVTGGGKKLSFRTTMAVGNHRDKIGLGMAKGADVSQSIDKAKKDALKHLITIPLVKNDTIPFEIAAKYSASEIILKPAKEGKGIIAGGVIREILNLTGIKNITTKVLGNSHNVINNAKSLNKAFILLSNKYKNFKDSNKINQKIENANTQSEASS